MHWELNHANLRSTHWSVWSNINGITDTICNHLSTKHGNEWQKIVVLEKLKGWEKIPYDSKMDNLATHDVFTVEGFLEWLACWITIDDQVSSPLFLRTLLFIIFQSLNVIESWDLHDIFLYLNPMCTPHDISHCKKVTQIILEKYHSEWKKLVTELMVYPSLPWCWASHNW